MKKINQLKFNLLKMTCKFLKSRNVKLDAQGSIDFKRTSKPIIEAFKEAGITKKNCKDP